MNRVADVIRDDIKVMTAYQVADLPEGFIKLDAMECPHHPFAGYESLLSDWVLSQVSLCIVIMPRFMAWNMSAFP